METQNELELEIGNIEIERQTLKPTKVMIVKVEIVDVEKAKSKKVNVEVKHPDKEETINLSSVAYLDGKQVVNKGLWFNKDKEGNIQKGSALSVFLNRMNVKNLKELEGKEAETDLDGKYLCFKAY